VAPSPILNFTYRTRLSHEDLGVRMIDATTTVGTHLLSVTGGYLYTNTNPYVLYQQSFELYNPSSFPAAYYVPREEFTLNASANLGPWNLAGGVERNLQTGTFDSAAASAGWQNECLAINLIYSERFTSFNLDNGSTTVLLQITFKTLGNVGFSAI
jgi:LPS-assembly protein